MEAARTALLRSARAAEDLAVHRSGVAAQRDQVTVIAVVGDDSVARAERLRESSRRRLEADGNVVVAVDLGCSGEEELLEPAHSQHSLQRAKVGAHAFR